MPQNVFVSHVDEDSALALELAGDLEDAGLTTWYYERDSVPGPPYLSQVARAIEESDIVAVIISAHSLSSQQVTNEVIRAYEEGKPFVPLLVGISHMDFQKRRPEWRQAMGASTSITIPESGLSGISRRVIAGTMALLGSRGVGSANEDSPATPVTTPRPLETGTRPAPLPPETGERVPPAAQSPTPQSPAKAGSVRSSRGKLLAIAACLVVVCLVLAAIYLAVRSRIAAADAAASYQRGSALVASSQPAQAEAPLREAVRLEPGNAAYQAALGDDLYAQKRYLDAEPFYQAAKLAPANASIQESLGNDLNYEALAFASQQNYSEAEHAYQEALPHNEAAARLQPNDAISQENVGNDFYNLGDATYSDGKYSDAEAAFRNAEPYYHRALVLSPSDSEQRENMADDLDGIANSLFMEQKYPDAESYYREAIRWSPREESFRKHLADCLAKEGKS